MAKDDSPPNGFAAIYERFRGLEHRLAEHDKQHKHHFNCETEIRAMMNEKKGMVAAWIALSSIIAAVASMIAAYAAFAK